MAQHQQGLPNPNNMHQDGPPQQHPGNWQRGRGDFGGRGPPPGRGFGGGRGGFRGGRGGWGGRGRF